MSFAPVFSRFRPASLRRVSACSARTAVLRLLLLGPAFLLPGLLRAQSPGSLDTSYTPDLNGATTFAVLAEYDLLGVETIAVGGDAAELNFTQADGTVVTGFDAPFFGNLNRLIYTIVPELLTITTTGTHNLYLGGRFGKDIYSHPIGSPAQNIIRLSPEGVYDTAFQPGIGADDTVTAIVPLDNGGEGGLIIGGLFTMFNGQSFPRLVRLNENGSVNSAFTPVNVTDGVFAMAAQIDPATGATNGQVLVGGDFSTVNNGTYTKLFRMDEAGNIDTTFRPVIDSRVISIAVQPNGKIVIAGQFATVNGQTVGHLARLNMDGSLDTTFNGSVSVLPTGTSAPVAAYVLHLIPDGRMYVGGQFDAVDGVTRHYVARIESDGSLDTSFDPGSAIINSVQSIAVQADNRILVGETASKKLSSVVPPSLERLYGDPVTTTLAAVSLDATKTKARKRVDGTRENGQFVLRRTGTDLTGPLTVYFEVSGTAQNGVDYIPLVATQVSGSVYQVTFAANQTKIKIKVKPISVNSDVDLTLTLLPSQNASSLYDTGEFLDSDLVGASSVGTVEIRNTD